MPPYLAEIFLPLHHHIIGVGALMESDRTVLKVGEDEENKVLSYS